MPIVNQQSSKDRAIVCLKNLLLCKSQERPKKWQTTCYICKLVPSLQSSISMETAGSLDPTPSFTSLMKTLVAPLDCALITSPTGMLLMGMGFGCSVFEHKYFISEQLINQTSTVIIILCAGGRICPQVKSNPMIQQALFSYVTLAHETKSPWNKKWLLEISLGNSCFCAELHSLSHKLSSAYDIFCLHSSCRLDSA